MDILRSVHREYRDYFSQLIKEGWTVEITKKKTKLRSPKGGLVSCSLTPSCPFALKHIQGDVRRLMRKETFNQK